MEASKQYEIIRELAKQYRAVVEAPENRVKQAAWADHNDLTSGTRPLFCLFPDGDGA